MEKPKHPKSMLAAEAPPRARTAASPNFPPEIGDRIAGDSVSYPDDDVVAVFNADGKWQYSRKDGTPY